MVIAQRALWLVLTLLLTAAGPAAAATYCTSFESTTPVLLPAPSQAFDMHVRVRNCGSLVWDVKGANRVDLAYHWYQGGTLVQWDAGRVPLPHPTAHGQTADISLTVTAPAVPGEYQLVWDLVRVGKNNVLTWFSQAGAKTELDPVTVFAPLIGKVIAAMTPKITSIDQSVVRPRQHGLLFGTWFGNDVGEVKLRLPSGQTLNLIVRAWSSGIIHFEVPPITGERDGTAAIWVATKDGRTSNVFTLPFRATRELLSADPALKVVQCGDPALASDFCWVTFYGIHSRHVTECCFTGDDGRDTYSFRFPLANGWGYDRHSAVWWAFWPTAIGASARWDKFAQNCYGKCPWAKVTVYAAKGGNTLRIDVDWDTAGVDQGVEYIINVLISGPKGVPFK